MGNIWFKPRDKVHYPEEFVVIASDSDWCLKFEGNKSYGVCVGIDIDSNNNVAAKSARQVRQALAGNIVPQGCVREYGSENEYTKEEFRRFIKADASNVQEEGIFVFHFSGYAFLHNNEWVLALANCKEDASSGITATDLMEWMGGCKAHHILIILDCYGARGFCERLISQVQTSSYARPRNQEVHIMCSCCTTQISQSVKIGGVSIFSYFLSNILRHSTGSNFDIKSNMDKIIDLCHSFSTLILNYTKEDGLTSMEMQLSMDSSLL